MNMYGLLFTILQLSSAYTRAKAENKESLLPREAAHPIFATVRQCAT